MGLLVKINEIDNVAIAVQDIPAGTKLPEGMTTLENIPQAHKVAFHNDMCIFNPAPIT